MNAMIVVNTHSEKFINTTIIPSIISNCYSLYKMLKQTFSKFEILSDSTSVLYNYRVNITLKKRYELYLDSTYKILIFV